jgi:HPt (histidine-containing phosphotransfer) domain-containing protein
LNTFIRDRHPEEARKYKTEIVADSAQSAINPKLLEVFRRDAKKAITTLQETKASGNIELFTITIHAMKSALANIGEDEASRQASGLENAGLNSDTEYITANVDEFIETLKTLVENLQPVKTANAIEAVMEDTTYLAEQLQIIKSACDAYDDTAAYAALDRLKEKQWKPETAAALETIRDTLFLHSDFEKAAEMSLKLLEK